MRVRGAGFKPIVEQYVIARADRPSGQQQKQGCYQELRC
jgi:hypothetical protein